MTLPSYVASSNADMGTPGNGTSMLLTRPAAWVSGLAAFSGLYKENGNAVAAPSGWVEVSGSPFAAGTSFWAHVFYKILGGSEPANYTWSWTGSVWREGGALALLDTDQTTPIDQIAGQSNASSTTITAPAVTPSVNNTLLLVLGFYFNDGAYTSNTGMTERIDFGGRAFTMATETGPAATVSSGTNTFTSSVSAAVNVGVAIAVQEVQSPPPPPSGGTYYSGGLAPDQRIRRGFPGYMRRASGLLVAA